MATAETPAPARVRRGRHRARRATAVRFTVAAAASLVMVFPIYWMFVTSVSTPNDLYSGRISLWPSSFHWENYTDTLAQWPFARWFTNSLTIAVIAVVLTVALNLAAGFAFAKLDFPFRNALFLLVVSTLMVPVQVIMIPQFQVVADLGLLNTQAGVWLPRLAEAFGLFLSRQYMSTLPDELLEAARVDGASPWRTFRSIVLPLCRPLVAVLVIFTFMWRWNEFAWPLIVLREAQSYTLPVGLLFLKGQFGRDYGGLMAMSLLSVLPMLAVFALFQRLFVEGMARSGIK